MTTDHSTPRRTGAAKSLTGPLRWAAGTAAVNLLAWVIWAAVEPAQGPGTLLWESAYDGAACFDCPRYVLLDRAVDEPLSAGPARLLALVNRLPLMVAVAPKVRVRRYPQVVRADLFALASTAQWCAMGLALSLSTSRTGGRGRPTITADAAREGRITTR